MDEEEFSELKVELKNLRTTVQILMAGGAALNRRIEMLESLSMTISKLAQTTADTINIHLEEIHRAMDVSSPTSAPEKKKETHPEFG